MDHQAFRTLVEELIPFNKFLGLKVIELAAGEVLFEIPFQEFLIGDPKRRALHGGVTSMLADTALGLAVWSKLEDPRARVSTIDLRVDYLRPGKEHSLFARARVVRVGKTVGVADAVLFQTSEAEPIATGKGVYAIRTAR